MKKDVIYVDIEDDITSIIEKVKAANAKIVALVPPKRIGVLQSVVNLKLLQRAATSADKRVVLITNNQSLATLAAGVSMPVAKNLQSKPEVAPVSALSVDDEDVINGDELPVGELASTSPVEGIEEPAPAVKKAAPVAALAAAKAPRKLKIPDFDSARKKIFIFGGAGLALLIFLVWAIFFAPHATVNVTAATTPYNIGKTLNLSAGVSLNADTGAAPIIVKEVQKTNTVDFQATGKKNVGDKAKGIVTLTNNTQISKTVPAGTELRTSGGLVFTTDAAVEVAAGTIQCNPFPNCQGVPGSEDVAVTAAQGGANYNGATGSLSGAPSGVSAAFDGAASGGTDRTATVVSTADVEKAKEQLKSQDSEAVKKELKSSLDGDVISIDESFTVTAAEPSVSPAVDQEAAAGKITAETKYLLLAIEKDNLQKILEADIRSQLDGLPNQKIYDSGVGKVKFANFASKAGGVYSADVQAVGYVGPNIDADNLAKQVVGKRAGEIQAQVQAVDGVESVDVQFSPFWVTSAPASDKITIKFLVKNETN